MFFKPRVPNFGKRETHSQVTHTEMPEVSLSGEPKARGRGPGAHARWHCGRGYLHGWEAEGQVGRSRPQRFPLHASRAWRFWQDGGARLSQANQRELVQSGSSAARLRTQELCGHRSARVGVVAGLGHGGTRRARPQRWLFFLFCFLWCVSAGALGPPPACELQRPGRRYEGTGVREVALRCLKARCREVCSCTPALPGVGGASPTEGTSATEGSALPAPPKPGLLLGSTGGQSREQPWRGQRPEQRHGANIDGDINAEKAIF